MQPRDQLTTKEIQVATLVWQGLTNRDIAGVLSTSEQVVKNYLRTAFDKLGTPAISRFVRPCQTRVATCISFVVS